MVRLLQFIYLSNFESAATGLLDEPALHGMEQRLMADPEAGARISGTGGVRKLRVALPGRGRSGGARVIYYYRSTSARVYLLYVYPKNEATNLSARGKALLRSLVRRLEEEP